MFWIIGGDGIAAALGGMTSNPTAKAIALQVSDHVEWVGFRYYDMIFPLFLFIIGATLPFSLGRQVDRGVSKNLLIRKVLKRAAILFFLGMVYNGLLHFNGWDHFRPFGVLQRQAFGYCVAGLLFLTTKPRTQAIIGIGILFFYWALLVWAPVPGAVHDPFSQWGNFPNYVDRMILLPHQMYEKYGDPEGPVSMIPAISTALIGLFAGRWLKSERQGDRKALGLAAAGLVCLVLGLAWSPFLPVIKKIWTSSYVLVAGGFSLELLALFYWLIDVRGWKNWCFPFVVIGMNPITIYLLMEIVDFDRVQRYFLGGIAKTVPADAGLISAVGVVLAEWLLLYFLYKNKMFFRV
jgi:predicted acyltransferase